MFHVILFNSQEDNHSIVETLLPNKSWRLQCIHNMLKVTGNGSRQWHINALQISGDDH